MQEQQDWAVGQCIGSMNPESHSNVAAVLGKGEQHQVPGVFQSGIEDQAHQGYGLGIGGSRCIARRPSPSHSEIKLHLPHMVKASCPRCPSAWRRQKTKPGIPT